LLKLHGVMSVRITENRIFGYFFALGGIAAVTAVCLLLRRHINDATVVLAMLLIVLFTALIWGSKPALVASAIGVLSLNFVFLLTEGLLPIEESENVIALAAFLITALTVGQLSASVKQRAAEAEAGRKEATPNGFVPVNDDARDTCGEQRLFCGVVRQLRRKIL